MNPLLIDPNNHVPEASAEDVWDDADVMHSSGQGPATVLPPKKVKSEHESAANRAPNEGLRIEPGGTHWESQSPEDSERQLEVQEIDGTVVRLDPEMPTAERVPRQEIAFVERPVETTQDRLRRGEAKDWGISRKYALPWIIGTGLGVAGMVVGALMLLPTINKSNAARLNPAGMGLSVEIEAPLDGVGSLDDLITRQPEAEQIFRAFATAPIVADLLPLIRDAKTLKPLIRSQRKGPWVPRDWLPAEETTWNVGTVSGMPYGTLAGPLPNYSSFCAYFTVVDGNLLLDWKASTAFCSATFEELAQNQGDATEIRGILSPTNYYSTTFPESDFDSYQLVAPDNHTSVWCYAPKSDPVADQIRGFFKDGGILTSSNHPVKITVSLERGPAGALPNQWLISEVLHEDWIHPTQRNP